MFAPGWPLRAATVIATWIAWVILMVVLVASLGNGFLILDFVGAVAIGFFGMQYVMTRDPFFLLRS